LNGITHVLTLSVMLTTAVYAQMATLPAIAVMDTPNDAGGSITMTWPRSAEMPPGTVYRVYIGEEREGPFQLAAEIDPAGSLMSEDLASFGHSPSNDQFHYAHISSYESDSAEGGKVPLESDRPYFARLGVRTPTGESRGQVAEVSARGNYFNWAKLNNFILGTLFSIVILASIAMARRKELYVRRIAGLEALDEALGRATEMGKAVLFVHGLRGMDQIPTIASVNILSRVARRTAEYDTTLMVTNIDPVVMAVSQETVKEAYIEAGRPDAYREDNIFIAATDQFSYAAAVEGIMLRERPAAHIMMGHFFAESLLLAETGTTTGAIQIAGTDSYTQLPFFITTCDYTLMGEELYAASAYLSREPRLLGSLKGQDIGKGVILLVLVAGTLLAGFDIPILTQIFTSY
jgi:hypothetical protein